LVASSTSNAGTIWPAGMASILIEPWVSFSSRSPKILKCSWSVLLAGQVDCILSDFVAGACACAAKLSAAAARMTIFIGDLPEVFSFLNPGLRAVNRNPRAHRLQVDGGQFSRRLPHAQARSSLPQRPCRGVVQRSCRRQLGKRG